VAGNLQVAGGATVNWTGGAISGALNVASNGVLNLLGGSGLLGLSVGGTLTNAGTVNWTNGEVHLDDYFGVYLNAGPIVNLAGGVWNIQCDQVLLDAMNGYPYNTNAYFLNQGLVRKTAGSGKTKIGSSGSYAVLFENFGTVEADMGTISFEGGYSGSPAANLAISLRNVTPGSGYGNIAFLTPLSLGGTFIVSTSGGYLPSPGDTFQVLNYPSSTNSFTCLSGLDLGSGILLQPQFGSTGLTLQAAAYTTGASQPQLFINRTLGGVAITWPVGFPDWTLQSTTNLSSPAWTAVSNPCGNQAVVPTGAPQQYFRLNKN
jgi:hypothetical protein